MKRIFSVILVSMALIGLSAVRSWSAVITSGPFAGTMSESWENFPRFNGVYPASPMAIMSGRAFISSPLMAISGTLGFGIGTSGIAVPSDGVQLLGLNYLNQTATINWPTPVSQFGGYFGAGTGGAPLSDPAIITVQFFNPVGMLIDTTTFPYSRSATRDGSLDWHGWVSSEPIGSISLTGDFLVTDGLQAIAVPEPRGLSLIGCIAAGMVAYRLRIRSSVECQTHVAD